MAYWGRQACANSVDTDQMQQDVDVSTLFATHPAIFRHFKGNKTDWIKTDWINF